MSRIRKSWSVCVTARVMPRPPATPDARRIAETFALQSPEPLTLYQSLRLTVRPGQILAVTGPSGAGKSVLLRAIAARVRGAVPLGLDALAACDLPAIDACRATARGMGILPMSGKGRSPTQVPPSHAAVTDDLSRWMEILSRCGLAEARALVTPCRDLSGGQLYRLALARAIHLAMRRGRATLVIADEFASSLDLLTAGVVCRQVRKLITGSNVALALATPRHELLPELRPDIAVFKPTGSPAVVVDARLFAAAATSRAKPSAGAAPSWAASPADVANLPIEPGTIHDYDRLAAFHYVGGRPAAHKRVYVIRSRAAQTDCARLRSDCAQLRNGAHKSVRSVRTRKIRKAPDSTQLFAAYGLDPSAFGFALAAPDVLAVLVVSPPVPCVRGRNVATAGRYLGPRRTALARLNREVECISRVIVHPDYRGCGLARRLVRHALAHAATPYVEALAAMGAVHPLFELAGMTSHGAFEGRRTRYTYYLAPRTARPRGRAHAKPINSPAVGVAVTTPLRMIADEQTSTQTTQCLRPSHRRRRRFRPAAAYPRSAAGADHKRRAGRRGQATVRPRRAFATRLPGAHGADGLPRRQFLRAA